MTAVDAADLATAVRAGDRSALGRAITLVESSKAEDEARALALIETLLPSSGNAIRIGLTGPPGVGKSTTIDQFGSNLTTAGHKVAVLAVDPSSVRTGGSILGDKTRMARLSADPDAFIRPSPAADTLGGVARRTRESIILCEAAGYDVIIVETVGIGQSEATVSEMVDFFVVLALPGAGDELQGIKKGVLEVADLLAVNKADGELTNAAARAVADYTAAFHIIVPTHADWRPPVIAVSALLNQGLDRLWSEVGRFRAIMEQSGRFDAKRADQQARWMRRLVEERVMSATLGRPEVREALNRAESAVRAGETTPDAAARSVLELVMP